MQKTKKQKYEQEIRKSLKTILNLDPQMVEFIKNQPLKNQTILSRSYSKLHEIQLLRTLALMEINFIIFAYVEILEKTKAMRVQDLKIGIIGGGIMGRLIINTLLVFTKQGLKTSNILVSTRQPHHLQFYSQNFGIQTFFDNDKIAEEAHIIFVATPATLDNWIILDLKNKIQKSKKNLYPVPQSTRTSEASTVIIQNSQPISSQNSVPIRASLEKQVNSFQLKKTQLPIFAENVSINPLIFILTSDFTAQKSKKLFSFPVHVPYFRANNLSSTIQKLKKHFESLEIQKFSNNPDNLMKEIQSLIAKQQLKQTQSQQTDKNVGKNALIQNIIRVLDFSFKNFESYWKKNGDFFKNNKSTEPSEASQFYKDIFHSNGTYEQNFLTKSRKWRMAYNNFIG